MMKGKKELISHMTTVAVMEDLSSLTCTRSVTLYLVFAERLLGPDELHRTQYLLQRLISLHCSQGEGQK